MDKYVVAGYIGAKAKIADKVVELLVYDEITTYVEVFGGLFGVGLNKPRHQIEIYNDINPKLAHLMGVLSTNGDELLRKMLETEYSHEAFLRAKEDSNKIKDMDQLPDIDDIDKAVAVWITLLQSRNGMMDAWKGFSKGNEELVYKEQLIKKFDLPDRVKGTQIMNRDALELIKELKYREDVMMYCDSPYVTTVRTSGNLFEYEMKDSEQWVYAELIKDAKAKVIIAGYQNEIYDTVLTEEAGWYSFPLVEVAKSSGNTKSATKNREVEWIWMNYKLEEVKGNGKRG